MMLAMKDGKLLLSGGNIRLADCCCGGGCSGSTTWIKDYTTTVSCQAQHDVSDIPSMNFGQSTCKRIWKLYKFSGLILAIGAISQAGVPQPPTCAAAAFTPWVVRTNYARLIPFVDPGCPSAPANCAGNPALCRVWGFPVSNPTHTLPNYCPGEVGHTCGVADGGYPVPCPCSMYTLSLGGWAVNCNQSNLPGSLRLDLIVLPTCSGSLQFEGDYLDISCGQVTKSCQECGL